MEKRIKDDQPGAPSYQHTIGFLVLLITVMALVLRLLLLGQDSFWADEISSVIRAQLNRDEFSELMRSVPAMALYYALLRFWIFLGDNEFTVRLLSVGFAVITVPLVYLLGKRLFHTKVGLIAAVLLAVNAFHIQYSQEARSYALVVLLVTLSSLFFARGVERPSSWRSWDGYAVFTAAAIYAHWYALLVLVAQLCSLAFLPRRNVPWEGIFTSWFILGVCD